MSDGKQGKHHHFFSTGSNNSSYFSFRYLPASLFSTSSDIFNCLIIFNLLAITVFLGACNFFAEKAKKLNIEQFVFVLLGNFKLLVVGGYNGGAMTNSAEMYDLESPNTTCSIFPDVPVGGFEGLNGGRLNAKD